SVVITNVSGAVTSVVASLTVFAIPLEITLQPQDITNTMGVPATFTVTADGIDPISYQWWKDGALLNGATDDKLDITSVDTSDAGGYYVVVTNAYTSVTSAVATLTVLLTVPVDYVWTSPVSGDWSQESNWSPLG